MKAGTNLEKVLESGHFAVTAEVGPPKGSSPAVIRRRGELVRNSVDAVNVTDNQTAVVRMSSVAGCAILKTIGVDPVMQIVCRDRNRIAIQSDVLGAIALGIGNILCLSGDHQRFGNHPSAKGVFDIDSMQLIQTLKSMRDEKQFISGEDVSGEIPIYIGAAANPFADPFEFRVLRLAKKVAAGVDFIQTQIIYNVEKFAKWMEAVRERGLHEKVKILAGVAPIKSVGAARYMQTRVPGMDVPDAVVDRLRSVPKEEVSKEGIKVCVDIINQVREIKGVAGIHLMAIEWEEVVPEIVEQVGLLPRPQVS